MVPWYATTTGTQPVCSEWKHSEEPAQRRCYRLEGRRKQEAWRSALSHGIDNRSTNTNKDAGRSSLRWEVTASICYHCGAKNKSWLGWFRASRQWCSMNKLKLWKNENEGGIIMIKKKQYFVWTTIRWFILGGMVSKCGESDEFVISSFGTVSFCEDGCQDKQQ